VVKLGPQLPERSLLPYQPLRHLIKQAGRSRLDVLPDSGLGFPVARSRLGGGLVQMLEQVVDGLPVLLVHTNPDTPPGGANTTADGDQLPMLNVFHRDGNTVRHFWGSELFYAPTEPGQETRHVGTIEPLWNLFDLTPEGRGTGWDEQLDY
jgi:hypothetical protein